MTTKTKLLTALTAGAFVCAHLNASMLVLDAFDYDDGPLAGQGNWDRMAGTTDPSLFPVVSSGAVRFDLTGTQNNYGARYLWPAEDAVSGSIFAIFDFTMVQEALDNDLRAFLTFADSGGNAQRGAIGIRRGINAGEETFRFEIGPTAGSMATLGTDFVVGTTYRVMFEYDGTNTVNLWVGTTDPNATPDFTRTATATGIDVRRVNLRVDSLLNMGIYEIDNLMVTTIPEPRVYAALAGLLALGFVMLRRRRS